MSNGETIKIGNILQLMDDLEVSINSLGIEHSNSKRFKEYLKIAIEESMEITKLLQGVKEKLEMENE